MNNVIRIEASEDLGTRARNALRYAIELGMWRRAHREALAEEDYAELDRLDRDFERVGLP